MKFKNLSGRKITIGAYYIDIRRLGWIFNSYSYISQTLTMNSCCVTSWANKKWLTSLNIFVANITSHSFFKFSFMHGRNFNLNFFIIFILMEYNFELNFAIWTWILIIKCPVFNAFNTKLMWTTINLCLHILHNLFHAYSTNWFWLFFIHLWQ